MKSQKPYMCPIIIGILLVLIGLIIRVPGGALTTYKSLDGESAGGYYAFDNRYSSIDEYVGGDAYNYIIGASLVAGKTAGVIAAKAISIVGGAICFCFGLTLKMMEPSSLSVETPIINGTETVDPAGTPKKQDNSAVQEPETEQEPSSELS